MPETSFVLGLAVFISIIVFLSGMATTVYPSFTLLSNNDLTIISGEAIGIAGACAIATGIPCAGALVIGSIFGFVTITNTMFYTLIMLPCLVTLAFVMARLARGGG